MDKLKGSRITAALDDVKSALPDKIVDKIDGAQDKLQDAIEGAQDKLHDTIDGAQDKLLGAIDGAQDKVQGAIESAQDKLRDTMELMNPERILTGLNVFINHPTRKLWPQLFPSILPLLIASIGSIGTAIVMNLVSNWPLFQEFPQLIIMFYPFMGMVTNIMSMLSARVQTATEAKTSDQLPDLKSLLFSNLIVVQCQALLASIFTSLTTMLVSVCRDSTRSKISLDNGLLLNATAMITSIVTNTILVTVYGVLEFFSRKSEINLSQQTILMIVSTVRDICSVGLLALVAQSLQQLSSSSANIGLLVSLLLIALGMTFFARRNEHTKLAIFAGWGSMLGGIVFEQGGGVMMQSLFAQYPLASALQPLLNGIAGNMIRLHCQLLRFFQKQMRQIDMPDFIRNFVRPVVAQFIYTVTSRIFLFAIIPMHLVALGGIYIGQLKFDYSLSITIAFFVCYSVAVYIHLSVLLKFSYSAVLRADKRSLDWDTKVQPTITSLINVSGIVALTATFAVLSALQDPNGSKRLIVMSNATNVTEA